MEVGRSGVVGVRPQLVLAPDRVRQRVGRPKPAVRTTQEQLRRIAVSAAYLADVDARIEDGEIRPPVAVEIIRDHDRIAHVDRPFDQRWGLCQIAVFFTDEHVQPRLRQSLLRRPRVGAVLLTPSREDIVSAIAVEIGNGEHEIEPAEAGLHCHTGKAHT